MRLLAAITCIVVFLTACAQNDIAVLAVPEGWDTVSPGSTPVDATTAAILFKKVCVENYPDTAKTDAAIKSMPFAQNLVTGTHYHRNFDLSFKVNGGGEPMCSMIFSSRDKAFLLAVAMASTASISGEATFHPDTGDGHADGPNGSVFRFRAATKNGRKKYYHAVLIPAP